MVSVKDLEMQIEDANALGIANLTEKGVEIPESATTYDIMSKIAEVSGNSGKEEQEKTITITENGTTEILPDENKALSKVTVVTDVEGITPLDNTVTFTVDGEPYEIVSVKSGNSVNEPILPQNTLFDVWRDTNNNKIEFPYTPTNDIELSTQITDLVKLEYIESTGTQYIDLGYAPTNTTNVVCEMMITNSNFPSANMGIFGTRNNKKGTDNFYIGIYSAWTYIGYGSKDTRSIYSGNSFVLNEKQTIIFGKDNMIIGNWNVGAISNEVSTESTMYLFAKNVVGEAPLWLSSGLRVYSFKVYEGEELVREYIPAISSEEGHVNEPCLYDTVTKAYFYNLGTGEFIKN